MNARPLVAVDEVRAWLEMLPECIAITGGTGFVGSHLVDTLCAAGKRPRVLVRDSENARWIGNQPVDLVQGDLEDSEALSRLMTDAGVVIHLAGVVRAASAESFDRANRLGTRKVLEALHSAAPDCRLVHISSLAAVGPSATPEGAIPEVEPHPVSYYGRSKLGAEREVVRGAKGQRWLVLRPPAIYGPRDTDVFQFFKMAHSGWMAAPRGERWISVAYVGDVVRAILAAAAIGEDKRIYHLGEQQPYSLDHLLKIVAETGGVRARLVSVPVGVMKFAGIVGSAMHSIGFSRMPVTRDKMGELLAHHWTARTDESLEDLGCAEVTRFPEGAEITWDWYRSHGWLS
ncbi:MAG: NAD-dependent epimerase/dehydratase family protein [bacterium]|nr:NAD-dependent epimerase/dehydratase family protein [bacterium]